MDWDKIRIFHTVAKSGSLTAAGYELNISQSAVSRQISALEKDLKVQLFLRHARGLLLTEQGEILFKTTRSVFAQLASVSALISESEDGLAGVLRVGSSVAFGSVWLSKRIPLFKKMYPNIDLEIILTDEDVDFSLREADVSISFNRQIIDYEVIQKNLFKFELGVYASSEYIKNFGAPENVDDLSDHGIIVFGDYSSPPVENVNWLLRIGTKPGQIRIPTLSINNAFGILESVRNGLGIATIASFIANDYPDLISILPKVAKPEVQAKFMFPKKLRDSRRVQVFYDFIVDELIKSKNI